MRMITRALGRGQNAAQPEDNSALILSENLDRIDQIDGNNKDKNQAWNANTHHGGGLALPKLYRSSIATG